MTHPMTMKANIVTNLTNIVNDAFEMLETSGLTELEFFTLEEAREANTYKFFENMPYYSYSCCDDEIQVYTMKVAKINGKWVSYGFDIELQEVESFDVMNLVLMTYNFRFAYMFHTAIYNKLNNTNLKIYL